jgi:hypothetical protein
MSRARKTFTARRPVDLVAAVPYLLGFHPEDSVVLMTFGPGETFHARVDLPVDEDDQAAVAEMLTGVVVQHGIERVAVLVYTEAAWVAATFHDAVVPAMVTAGVDVIDVLRVGRQRFHSAAEPADPGTAYDLRAHPFTAEQVVEGTVVHRSRAELAASLDPADPDDADVVAAVVERIKRERRGPRLVRGRQAGCDSPGEALVDAMWIQGTLAARLTATSHASAMPAADVGRLIALVEEVPLRDVAWAEMTRELAARHVALWQDVVRRCPPELAAAPASLLAFAAWLNGNGALAWCALDRAAAVDRTYPMAGFVATLLEQAVPPSTWSLMTEGVVARRDGADDGDAPAAS